MINKATFAGGCFWCMVKPFDAYEGVLSVVSGYTGGEKPNPTYEEICKGDTGHYEAVQITYDDSKITYDELLRLFWKQIDPMDTSGQFADRGSQYFSAIFYHDEEQRETALKQKKEIENNFFEGEKIATKIVEATEFFPAEDYHQKYYQKNPTHYSRYYKNSGRYNYVKAFWDRKNTNRDALKEKLSDIQYEVTQNDMTEVPFENEYFDKFDKGIYVDVVDGTPLFSSSDKFKGGCGWPSFTKPIVDTTIYFRMDYSFGMERVEVRSAAANSHLGHVFDDGPTETKKRYCINSASLVFVPYDKMEEYGYKEFLKYIG